jgi:hypothetical protein
LYVFFRKTEAEKQHSVELQARLAEVRRLEQDCQARDKAARAKDSQLADLNKRFAALRQETEATVNVLKSTVNCP